MNTNQPNRGFKWRGRGRGGYRGRNNWYRNKNFRKPGNDNRNGNIGKPVDGENNSVFESPVYLDDSNAQTLIVDTFKVLKGPYRGWKLYFPQEEFKETSSTVDKIKSVESFIKKHGKLYPAAEIEERRTFSVDFKKLLADEEFTSSWSGFETDLSDMPEHSLSCLGIAMHQIVSKAMDDELIANLPDAEKESFSPLEIPIIRARVLNYEPVIHLKNLKTNYYGKLVSIRGTIIRAGNIKLLCDWLAFECNTCQKVQCVRQPEGVYTQPHKCITKGCRSKSFAPQRSSPLTQTVNWQSVRLQEIVGDDQREGGRVPRTVEIELTEDLVDSCVPGDVVTISGVVKVRNTTENVKKNAPSMYFIYIEGVSIQNSKSNTVAGRTSGAGIEFNVKDYYAIQEIHSQPQLFRLLVASLCPAIYSHEMVKAGLLLGLLGGSSNSLLTASNSTGSLDTRSDPHILVVGDPGLGKSQMLQACASVAPRGVYVCGNTSTASGLTVTLTRESGSDYALEAGALVLADQGVCCIDEFDKMSSQHQALLEAMEQQCISVAKAGVLCTLPARTSILAAANPVGGHYNRGKTVSENLKLASPLLSRFDLVFILMDQPNEHLDSLLSEHVMALHSGLKKNVGSFGKSSQKGMNESMLDIDRPLSERLKVNPNENLDVIPHQLLRKYIAYARKYVHPKVSPEAGEVLRRFYLKLREKHQGPDCTPVTTRQLESLIRLSEARAKAELREDVTEQDAIDVVEIMRCSLVDTFADEFGSLDFRRSQNGSGMSSKNQVKKFIAALQRLAEMQSRSVFTVAEMKQVVKTCGIQITDFFSFLTSLNTQGFLIKKGSQVYQLLTVDY
ncbi:DNA helicase MCM8 [Ischnura elegans]|uniref:DNA helicase MCM8 n=1 Tax=Ischnura elegans TaxID=197161 RepID=UPI001ED87960|nr:DNA helicase MCM8 [Ischnura elegans]